MNRIVFILLPLIFILQGSIVPQTKKSILPPNDLTISQIKEQTLEYSSEGEDTLMAIYALNVFSYFQLTDYDSPLKRKVYKSTPEYGKQLSTLKIKKIALLNTYFRIDVKKFNEGEIKGAYSLDKHGFGLNMGEVNSNERRPFQTLYVQFKTLPTLYINSQDYDDAQVEYIFLKTNETIGLKLEQNIENLNVYLIFKLGNIIFRKATTAGYIITTPEFTSNAVQIVAFNETNNEIYFSKNYIPVHAKPKK